MIVALALCSCCRPIISGNRPYIGRTPSRRARTICRVQRIGALERSHAGATAKSGLGSGVPRDLEFWPEIDFRDDRDGCLFVATVRRKEASGPPGDAGSEKSSEKSSEKILRLLSANSTASAREIAAALELTPRAVEKQIATLRAAGHLRRVGPAKGGRWEVLK